MKNPVSDRILGQAPGTLVPVVDFANCIILWRHPCSGGFDLPSGAPRALLSVQPGKLPAAHKGSRQWEGIADIVSLLRDDQRPSMAKVIFALIL